MEEDLNIKTAFDTLIYFKQYKIWFPYISKYNIWVLFSECNCQTHEGIFSQIQSQQHCRKQKENDSGVISIL